MHRPSDYYGYTDDDSELMYLLDKPAARPVGDGWVWLKHTVRILGLGLGQWLLALALIGISGIAVALAVAVAANHFGFTAATAAQADWGVRLGLLGVVAVLLLLPLLFAAGLSSCAAAMAEEGEFPVSRLFAGFGARMGSLAALGFLWLLMLLACAMFRQLAGGLPADALCFAVFVLCNWLVLPLLMEQGIAPLRAMGMSFSGCLKNIVPLSCYVVALLAALYLFGRVVLAGMGYIDAHWGKTDVWGQALKFLLVWLTAVPFVVLIPVAGYVSYRNIWTSAPLR